MQIIRNVLCAVMGCTSTSLVRLWAASAPALCGYGLHQHQPCAVMGCISTSLLLSLQNFSHFFFVRFLRRKNEKNLEKRNEKRNEKNFLRRRNEFFTKKKSWCDPSVFLANLNAFLSPYSY